MIYFQALAVIGLGALVGALIVAEWDRRHEWKMLDEEDFRRRLHDAAEE